MNTYLLIAAVLTFLLGAAHSVIGERLVFRLMRKNRKKLTNKDNQLPLRHQRIIWASWHLVTILGWDIGTILLWLSLSGTEMGTVQTIITISMLAGALIVLGGTKGKHPGWIVLLLIALFVWLG